MQNRVTKNLYETRNATDFDPDKNPAVFISYKRDPDRPMAKACAEILKSEGLYYWLDEERVPSEEDDVEIATYIEEGLDAASSLLGIIGTETFTSSWVPYETGGARGRQRFKKPFRETPLPEKPHPLIAHLILDNSGRKLPAFIKLGTPLRCLCEVQQWAKYIAEILQKPLPITFNEAQSIRDNHEIQKIYEKNIQILTRR